MYAGADAFLQCVEGGKVKTQPVTLGARSGEMVEILSGVSEGEEVVSRAGTFVADGDLVMPVRGGGDGSRQAMNISAWSIRNPVPAILLFIVLVALGLMSFSKLPVTRFPNIDIPLVSVTVTDPGVAPSELETQITKRIEDAVANISGVKNVISQLTEGMSQTTVEFRLEVDTQTAVNDVKDAVELIRSDLPATADDPVVARIDVEGQAILTYAVSAPAMTIEELSWFVDDTVIRKLQGLKGVARVDRYGGVTREIKVELDPDRLNALGVTAGDLNRALRLVNADMTGGNAKFGSRDQSIRTLGGAEKIADLEALEIPLGGGRKVKLSDIATVTDAWAEPKSFARVNSQHGRFLRHLPRQGRERRRGQRASRRGGRRPAEGLSGRVDHQGRQLGATTRWATTIPRWRR